jgi:hypothetical protein
MKLELLATERAKLRALKVRIADIPGYSSGELCEMLQTDPLRARHIHALAEFQVIPSIGIQFAKDLVSMGYYSLEELSGRDGARLVEEFEFLNGYWIDPCMEDQCRLVVHYAMHHDKNLRWWDFTEERKKYRAEHGYPENRPGKAWYELLKPTSNH